MRNTVWSLRMWGLLARSIPRTRRHPDGAHASYSFQAACARRSGSAQAASQRRRPRGRSRARSSAPNLGPARFGPSPRGEGARCARRLPPEPDGRGVGVALLFYGGRWLDDLHLLRSRGVSRLFGWARVPDATTFGRFLRRAAGVLVPVLDELLWHVLRVRW